MVYITITSIRKPLLIQWLLFLYQISSGHTFTALMPLSLFQGLFQQIDPIRANNFPKYMLNFIECQ